jgi:hypothetical protein
LSHWTTIRGHLTIKLRPTPTPLHQLTWLDEAPAGSGPPDWLVFFTGSSWADGESQDSVLKRSMLWEHWRMALAWCEGMAAPRKLGWVQFDDHSGFPMFCSYLQFADLGVGS